MKRFALIFSMVLLAVPALAAGKKPSVAILYFDYEGKTEEMAVLKKGLAQMLISDLSTNDSFQIVERARLQEIMDELKLGQSGKLDPATAAKIGKLVGAQYMVVGGFFDLSGMLRVDARVFEVETSKMVKGTGAMNKPDEFLAIEQKIAGELDVILSGVAKAAASKPAEKGEQEAAKARKLPAKTALRYSKALDAMDRKDKETAKKELEAVVKEQPDFMLASLDLAALAK
jgi:TolB-like protein